MKLILILTILAIATAVNIRRSNSMTSEQEGQKPEFSIGTIEAGSIELDINSHKAQTVQLS